jgi:hypothetical protein
VTDCHLFWRLARFFCGTFHHADPLDQLSLALACKHLLQFSSSISLKTMFLPEDGGGAQARQATGQAWTAEEDLGRAAHEPPTRQAYEPTGSSSLHGPPTRETHSHKVESAQDTFSLDSRFPPPPPRIPDTLSLDTSVDSTVYWHAVLRCKCSVKCIWEFVSTALPEIAAKSEATACSLQFLWHSFRVKRTAHLIERFSSSPHEPPTRDSRHPAIPPRFQTSEACPLTGQACAH